MDDYLFEQRFRLYLKKSLYNQTTLAGAMNVARSTVSKWIKGENRISFEDLGKACTLLELTEDESMELFTLKGYDFLPRYSSVANGRQTYDAILYRHAGNVRKPSALFGFDSLINEIDQQLDQRQHVLITGYGGTGKTALAATIADQRVDAGKGSVLWLGARVNSIEVLFESLLAPLNGHHELANLAGDAKIHKVREILARETVGGIVLDDLRSVQLIPKIRPAIPAGIPLLITSRNRMNNIDQIHNIPVMPPDDATALLARYADNSIYSESDYLNDPDAYALCERLKWHPLGLVIAGALLKQRQYPIATLIARLDSTGPLTVEMPPEFTEEGHESIKIVLDQTYNELSKAGQKLFRIFGLLHAPYVTRDFLVLYSDDDSWKVDDALHELLTCNFVIQEDRDFFAVHDLIHSYVEHRIRTSRHKSEKRLIATVQDYVQSHADAFDSLQHNLPNFLHTAEIGSDEQCLEIIAALALGGYQHNRGHRLAYLAQLDRVLAFQQNQALSEEGKQQLHHLLSKRGNAYFDRAEYQQAVYAYDNALDVAYDQERQAILLGSLGKVLRFLGDVAGSEQYFQQAYQIARVLDNNFVLSFVLEQHAYSAGYHDDHETARKVTVEQVAINEKLVEIDPSPQNQTRLFYSLNNWGTVELKLGQKPLDQILKIFQDAEALTKKLQSDELKAHAAWALAEAYHALGDRERVTQYLNRAFALYEEQGKMLGLERMVKFMEQNGYERNATTS